MIGPNGAGKSTLAPRAGAPRPPGPGHGRASTASSPTSEAERLAWRRRMACVFQEPLLCRGSVLYNARLACRLRGVARAESDRRARRLARAPGDRRAGRSASRPAVGWRSPADEPRPRLRRHAGGPVPRRALRRAGRADARGAARRPGTAARRDARPRPSWSPTIGPRPSGSATASPSSWRAGSRRSARPEQVFGAPAGEAVARFVGVENLLPGRVLAVTDGLLEVDVGAARLTVAAAADPGERVLVGCRPEDLTLGPGARRWAHQRPEPSGRTDRARGAAGAALARRGGLRGAAHGARDASGRRDARARPGRGGRGLDQGDGAPRRSAWPRAPSLTVAGPGAPRAPS